MQETAGNSGSARAGDRQDILGSIVSELASLISQVQTSIRLVETAIAREAAPADQEAADVVVLDDITPRYLKARAALNTCDAGLGAALHYLREANSDEFAGSDLEPV
jgi:hypothetical protein